MAEPSSGIMAASYFADDIRQEVGNKSTIVGIYDGDILLEELPATIARFVVFTTVIYPNSGDLPKSMRFRLVQTNGEVIEHKIADDALPTMPRLEGPRLEGKRMRYEISVVLSPFQIMQVGRMSAYVDIDGFEVFSGSIDVKQAS